MAEALTQAPLAGAGFDKDILQNLLGMVNSYRKVTIAEAQEYMYKHIMTAVWISIVAGILLLASWLSNGANAQKINSDYPDAKTEGTSILSSTVFTGVVYTVLTILAVTYLVKGLGEMQLVLSAMPTGK
jgi:uncharacterized membrane protein